MPDSNKLYGKKLISKAAERGEVLPFSLEWLEANNTNLKQLLWES